MHDEHWWSQWMPYDRSQHYRYCQHIDCEEVQYRRVIA